jgi:gliding motility-associated-like protein
LNRWGELSGRSISGEYYERFFVFTVQVEDIHGCKTEKEYTLEKDVFIPRAFTPNGDGVNDFFMRGYSVVIFDRLGIEIFRGDNGWDGTYKGNPVKHDIYFYKLRLFKNEHGNENIKTGYVGVEY